MVRGGRALTRRLAVWALPGKLLCIWPESLYGCGDAGGSKPGVADKSTFRDWRRQCLDQATRTATLLAHGKHINGHRLEPHAVAGERGGGRK